MLNLPQRNKIILTRKIQYYINVCFPGRGGGKRLAEEIGVPPQTVSNWLRGKRLPTASQLYMLANAFDVSPFELCGIRKKVQSKNVPLHIDVIAYLTNNYRKSTGQSANLHITHRILNDINSLLDSML